MRRRIAVIAGLFCLALPAGAPAQTYPSRPITFVVTAAAGGVTDVVARALGQRLSEAWGQQVVIENKGGAAHTIGAAQVAKAAPDGHTVLVAEAGVIVTNPTLYAKGKLPYDAETDFIPVTGLVRVNQALLADNALPVANVKELIALAKTKPGEITYATAGIGSAPHLNLVLFQQLAGVRLTPVHYRGAAPALNDLMAGHVNLMSVAVNLAVQPWRAGKLKILAIGTAERLPEIPDLPTAAESGLPGYESYAWFGMFLPAGTPREVVMKLNGETRRVFADPTFREKLLAPQMFQSMVTEPEPFAAFIRAEQAKWAKVIRDAGLKIE